MEGVAGPDSVKRDDNRRSTHSTGGALQVWRYDTRVFMFPHDMLMRNKILTCHPITSSWEENDPSIPGLVYGSDPPFDRVHNRLCKDT